MTRFYARKFTFLKYPPFTHISDERVKEFHIDDDRFPNIYDEDVRKGYIIFHEPQKISFAIHILGGNCLNICSSKL